MKTEIKNFKRLELKYVLTLAQKEKLLTELKNFLIPDKNWDENGNYKLESVYYDTKDLKFYNEKMEHKRYRKKIRIRRYVTEKNFDENSQVFVEIKEKAEEITLKRRIVLPYSEAKNFLEKWIIPNYKAEDKAIIEEICEIIENDKLFPQAITSYDRQAFFGKDSEIWLRMSFDTWVNFKRKKLEKMFLNNKDQKDGDIVAENLTIMEVKANNEFPEFVTKFLEENNILPVRMSKYCSAIEASETNLQKYEKNIFKNIPIPSTFPLIGERE